MSDSTPSSENTATDNTTTQNQSNGQALDPTTAYYQQYYQQYQQYYPYYQQQGYNGYTDYSQYYQQYQQAQLQQQTNKPIESEKIERTKTGSVNCLSLLITFILAQIIMIDDTQNINKDVKEWTHLDVSQWIKTVNNGKFARYYSTFIENEINGSVLLQIDIGQLKIGLEITNMMDRLQIHEAIQKLKQKDDDVVVDNNNDNDKEHIDNDKEETEEEKEVKEEKEDKQKNNLTVMDLQRAPPIKKKKKKRKNGTNRKENKSDNNERIQRHIGGTASFLKLSNNGNNNKTSSQLLIDKMTNNHKKRKLADIYDNDDDGIKHEIEWRYNENEKYDDLNIGVKDYILFKWEFTKNIWQFMNRTAYENNDFNTFIAEELCASNCNKYIWKPNKIGTYYFGCQIGNCSKTGNMKICIHVNDNIQTVSKHKKAKRV